MEGLYVRDMVEGKTVKLVMGRRRVFQWMSSDGSMIFYLEEGDLYVFDFETGKRKDLTADHGAGERWRGCRNSSPMSARTVLMFISSRRVCWPGVGAISGGR